MLGAPGLAVAVVRDAKVVYAKGFGFADLQNNVPVTPKTVFRLGSVTKQFTATIVMQLVQEGKLSLDSTLGSLLPDSPKAWSAVTVRQLLSHTGGIPNYTNSPSFVSMIRNEVTVDHINDNVISKPLDFAPGSSWSYSNSGYILLGQIIEKVTGNRFANELHKRILDPLGMHETYFVRETEIVKNRASGYTFGSGRLAQSGYINMTWPFAAGAMESTVLDLAKWDAALYTDKILPQTALAQMWEPVMVANGKAQDYGFAWETQTMNGIKLVFHGGGIPGFSTFILRAPSVGTTVIALCNWDLKDPSDLCKHVMGFLDHRLQAPPVVLISDTDLATTALIRKALESILAGRPDPAVFSPGMIKFFTPEMLHSVADTARALGPLKSLELTKSEDAGGSKTREYRVTFANATLQGQFVIGKTGLVEDAKLR